MAVDEAMRIEQKYSRYRADSLVSQINANAGGEPTALDDETLFLLTHAAKCHAISGGLFDITSGVLRRVWNFAGGVPPDPQQVHDILPLIGWDKVELDGRKIRLAKVGMEIDFGGIGKEYAVDRLAGILASAGVKSGIVNLGGDIRVIGPHLDGAPWQIFIAHPRRPGEIATTIALSQGALTTSGDYQKYFDAHGKRYCHILNSRTGQPVAYWQSVTILFPYCMDAGSYSTMGMLLEREALPFFNERKLQYLLIDPHGEINTNLT
jgi:thiamine biosynthesis lipoprotein